MSTDPDAHWASDPGAYWAWKAPITKQELVDGWYQYLVAVRDDLALGYDNADLVREVEGRYQDAVAVRDASEDEGWAR